MADAPEGPVAGQVFRYAFLWKRQHEAGEIEDRRPLGRFGPAFADRLRRALIAAAKADRAGIVDRQG